MARRLNAWTAPLGTVLLLLCARGVRADDYTDCSPYLSCDACSAVQGCAWCLSGLNCVEDKHWACPLGQEDHVSGPGGPGHGSCPDKAAYLAKVAAQRAKREEARRLEAEAREAERILLEAGDGEPQCTNPEDETCTGVGADADADADGAAMDACAEWAARGDCETRAEWMRDHCAQACADVGVHHGGDGGEEPAAPAAPAEPAAPAAPQPVGPWQHCADEGGECRCTGRVRYGKRTTWGRKVLEPSMIANGAIRCTNEVFGDPLPGTTKECQCQDQLGGGDGMGMVDAAPRDGGGAPPAVDDAGERAALEAELKRAREAHRDAELARIRSEIAAEARREREEGRGGATDDEGADAASDRSAPSRADRDKAARRAAAAREKRAKRATLARELARRKRLSADGVRGATHPYETLGLDASAPQGAIRRAYRKTSLLLHPDKVAAVFDGAAALSKSKPEAIARARAQMIADSSSCFSEVAAAYEILGSPEKRAVFDDVGDAQEAFNTRDEYERSHKQFSSNFYQGDPLITPLSEKLWARRMTGDAVWLVEFYAPWCGACQTFTPHFKEIAAKVSDKIEVGAVNCEKDKVICSEWYHVRAYPSLRLVNGKHGMVQHHHGDRGVDRVVEWALRVGEEWRYLFAMADVAQLSAAEGSWTPPPPKKKEKKKAEDIDGLNVEDDEDEEEEDEDDYDESWDEAGGGEAGGEGGDSTPQLPPLSRTSTFYRTMVKSQGFWVVVMTPGLLCDMCKVAKTNAMRLSAGLRGLARVGIVDCTASDEDSTLCYEREGLPPPPHRPQMMGYPRGNKTAATVTGKLLFNPNEVEPHIAMQLMETVVMLSAADRLDELYAANGGRGLIPGRKGEYDDGSKPDDKQPPPQWEQPQRRPRPEWNGPRLPNPQAWGGSGFRDTGAPRIAG